MKLMLEILRWFTLMIDMFMLKRRHQLPMLIITEIEVEKAQNDATVFTFVVTGKSLSTSFLLPSFFLARLLSSLFILLSNFSELFFAFPSLIMRISNYSAISASIFLSSVHLISEKIIFIECLTSHRLINSSFSYMTYFRFLKFFNGHQ